MLKQFDGGNQDYSAIPAAKNDADLAMLESFFNKRSVKRALPVDRLTKHDIEKVFSSPYQPRVSQFLNNF
jgi:hypothetical protein